MKTKKIEIKQKTKKTHKKFLMGFFHYINLCVVVMKTFIRRPGNKSKYLRHIIPLVPKEYNTYIEPFVGTGAVFLKLLPDRWIINDLNKVGTVA